MTNSSDHQGNLPSSTVRIMAVATGLSVAKLYHNQPLLAGQSLWGLIVGIFVLDFAIQATHISNQTRFFAPRADARSRLNTVCMFMYFMGGALGSLIGSYAWNAAQWIGLCVVLSVGTLLALLTFCWDEKINRPEPK